MGDRVLVRDSGKVQGPIVSTRSPVARGLLGTMCNGDAQQLEEGRMMPRSNILSNSWRAILSRSGGSLCGRKATGGPVVGMWWVTECFTGWSGGGGRSKERKSARRVVKASEVIRRGTDGLGEYSWVEMPLTCS